MQCMAYEQGWKVATLIKAIESDSASQAISLHGQASMRVVYYYNAASLPLGKWVWPSQCASSAWPIKICFLHHCWGIPKAAATVANVDTMVMGTPWSTWSGRCHGPANQRAVWPMVGLALSMAALVLQLGWVWHCWQLVHFFTLFSMSLSSSGHQRDRHGVLHVAHSTQRWNYPASPDNAPI